MNASSRLAISWAELILLCLLVLGGMGLWALVNEQVNSYKANGQPRIENYFAQNNIAVLEANLKHDQNNLADAQKESQRLEIILMELDLQYKSLLSDYPQLQNLNISTDAAIDTELLDKFLAVRLEKEIAHQLLIDLNSQVDTLTEASIVVSRTLAPLSTGSTKYQTAKMKKDVLDAQINILVEALVKQKLLFAEKSAQLSGMQALYPELEQYITSLNTSIPLNAQQAFWKLTKDQQRVEQTLAFHKKVISESETLVVDHNVALAAAQTKTSNDFLVAQRNFDAEKRRLVLLITIGLNIVYLGIIYKFINHFTPPKYPIHHKMLVGLAAGLIMILIGYQIFGLLAAAAIGVLGMIILMRLLSNHQQAITIQPTI